MNEDRGHRAYFSADFYSGRNRMAFFSLLEIKTSIFQPFSHTETTISTIFYVKFLSWFQLWCKISYCYGFWKTHTHVQYSCSCVCEEALEACVLLRGVLMRSTKSLRHVPTNILPRRQPPAGTCVHTYHEFQSFLCGLL